jgi:hypothetical protein
MCRFVAVHGVVLYLVVLVPILPLVDMLLDGGPFWAVAWLIQSKKGKIMGGGEEHCSL